MRIEIIKKDGRWLINDKTYDKLNSEEKDFFDQFISYMKYQFKCEKHNNQNTKQDELR